MATSFELPSDLQFANNLNLQRYITGILTSTAELAAKKASDFADNTISRLKERNQKLWQDNQILNGDLKRSEYEQDRLKRHIKDLQMQLQLTNQPQTMHLATIDTLQSQNREHYHLFVKLQADFSRVNKNLSVAVQMLDAHGIQHHFIPAPSRPSAGPAIPIQSVHQPPHRPLPFAASHSPTATYTDARSDQARNSQTSSSAGITSVPPQQVVRQGLNVVQNWAAHSQSTVERNARILHETLSAAQSPPPRFLSGTLRISPDAQPLTSQHSRASSVQSQPLLSPQSSVMPGGSAHLAPGSLTTDEHSNAFAHAGSSSVQVEQSSFSPNITAQSTQTASQMDDGMEQGTDAVGASDSSGRDMSVHDQPPMDVDPTPFQMEVTSQASPPILDISRPPQEAQEEEEEEEDESMEDIFDETGLIKLELALDSTFPSTDDETALQCIFCLERLRTSAESIPSDLTSTLFDIDTSPEDLKLHAETDHPLAWNTFRTRSQSFN